MAEMSQAEEAFTQATTADSSAPVKNPNPVYEVGFHLVPALDEAGVSATVESIRKTIDGAEVIAEGFPARITLAYVVERATQGKRDKFSEAYFGWIKFALTPQMTKGEAIPALEAMLRGTPAVLRYLLVETVREDIAARPARVVFASDRLEGKTLEKTPREAEKAGEVSDEELDKSIEALVKE